MRKRSLAALGIFVAGFVLLLAGFAAADFDLNNFVTGGPLVMRTFEAEGSVTKVVVRDLNANVEIVPSADGRARVTCEENEELVYDISEESGVLRVEKHDLREGRWGLYFGFWQEGTVTIEVPEGTVVDVETENGNIRMAGTADGIPYPTISLHSANGNVRVENVRAGEVVVETSNDAVEIVDIGADVLTVKTSNDPVTLRSVRSETITAATRNDDISLEDVVAKSLTASTDNDNITFANVNASENIVLETSNGDICGKLSGNLGDYSVESATTNGKNSLPEVLTNDGISLRAVTSNGDIAVTFTE